MEVAADANKDADKFAPGDLYRAYNFKYSCNLNLALTTK